MKRSLRSFLRILGPGFITGASDDDPSGIATYTQAGAGLGFGLVWLMVWVLPFMVAVQEMCARIAMATGKGLMQNLRSHASQRVAIVVASVLLIANSLNAGADLGMMAASLRLVVPMPFWFLLVIVTGLTLALQIFLSYKTYAKYLKWLCLSLFAYVVVAWMLQVDWMRAVEATLVPQIRWTSEYWLMLVALLGTTISPYLYFWQANQEVEEMQASGCLIEGKGRNPKCDWKDLVKQRRLDVFIGMFFSNAIAWFITVVAASTLFVKGIVYIETADQAATALAPFGGTFASILFALGIVGTGLLAVPVLTSSAAFGMAEAFGWKEGLERKWWDAKRFYGLIIGSTVVGALLNCLGIKPVRLLIVASVVNALVAPLMLLFVVRLGDDGKIMGKLKNGVVSKVLGYTACLLMASAALLYIFLSLF